MGFEGFVVEANYREFANLQHRVEIGKADFVDGIRSEMRPPPKAVFIPHFLVVEGLAANGPAVNGFAAARVDTDIHILGDCLMFGNIMLHSFCRVF